MSEWFTFFQLINIIHFINRLKEKHAPPDVETYFKVIVIKTAQCFLKKLNIELSYDPVILLLNIHPKEWKELPEERFIHSCSRHLTHNI